MIYRQNETEQNFHHKEHRLVGRTGLGLLSGGLDSLLAFKVLQEQGVTTKAIAFKSPFFNEKKAKISANTLGVELFVQDITDQALEIAINPVYGYGKNANPCIDCKVLMLKTALIKARSLQDIGFLFTGEVVGQRPMTQNKNTMNRIAKESGCKGILLRPLSAKLLQPTLPEENGIVDRDQLLAISGRSRRTQMEFATKYQIKNYTTPAGGCLLADPGFSKRLFEHLKIEGDLTAVDAKFLKIGRHFRLPESRAKLILGRNESENNQLVSMFDRSSMVFLHIKDIPGPVGLILSTAIGSGDINVACSICASYSDVGVGEDCVVDCNFLENDSQVKIQARKNKEFSPFNVLNIIT